MMTWLEIAASALRGGKADCCPTHGGPHETITVTANGPFGPFPIEVFDPEEYRDTEGYCTGDDEVSRGICAAGVWEKYGTALVGQVLSKGGPGILVIDLGSHLGWYSVLAAQAGFGVLAVDADLEHLDLLARNLPEGTHAELARGWIDADTPVLKADDAPRVRLLKIDLEGEETAAVHVCSDLLAKQRVMYALIEFSPIFGTDAPALVDEVRGYGYRAFVMPELGFGDEVGAFFDNPLGNLSEITGDEFVWDQRDVVFIRDDL